MRQFADWVKCWTDIKVKIIFEIGANYAQDAAGLAYFFKAKPEDVYAFEAHPQIAAAAEKLYNFRIYNLAVFNEEKELTFNSVQPDKTNNSGNSSLRYGLVSEGFVPIKVQAIRMDNFMRKNNIAEIDFLKLDIEGCNWEALSSFGNRLRDVKIIHVESEHEELWQGQKLWSDIKSILQKNGFELVFFQRYFAQSDSMWIQKKFLKSELPK
ncbi:MAG: FkbM family methyltransferase [Deltaproteobacteria bacterium]|jgi:FkbM family methyltransferase|nr:FkbM family methyltransferase [Deltaproteobacteria bacterium]